jgi:class 3 adenylate cyclase/tetratricopeptide (TPR) repeat protein
MTFEEILQQTVAILQSRGRVSYRALQRQFELDDAYLADLKEELLYAYPQVVEDEGRGLVWTRETAGASTPVTVSPLADQASVRAPLAYTPSYLAEKILTSRSTLEGERKQVTVLFADLKGSMELLADRDPEEARQLLDPVLERMMAAVHRYEGTVNQIMGDGIMALFGAPIAHEDHAVRACYAALAMQEAIRCYSNDVCRVHGLEVQIRVGLNSGEVVVRAIGNDLHMDYSAIGQTTHLAARMEQLAPPGSIRLTADTRRLAAGWVQVTPLGPVPVKGLSTPVEVCELVGAGPARTSLQAFAARRLTPFVGRHAEFAALHQALEQARAGHGQVVAVIGEAGVGKTRLFHEFTHVSRPQGWFLLESSATSYGKATPYLPVIDLLKAYCQIEDRDEARRIREKLTGRLLTLDAALGPTLPALLALLEVPVEDPAWHALDPAQRRQRTLEALKRLLLRQSQVQPLLLVFENLHWIDAETQGFLDDLVESLPTAPLLLLVNYRPEYEHGWRNKTYYAQLRLDPLPPASAEALLQSLLGDDAGLEPLKARLIAQAQGNPFFLEESVRTLVETQGLVGTPGAYRLAQALPSIQVPATVQAVLAARIDRLPPEEKQLLQTAAVIGTEVSLALLQAVAEAPEEGLRLELSHLQAAEFLYETRLFPEHAYTFKHALTQQVAYETLLQERRRALHARIVGAIEALYGDRLTEYVEQLAHHAVRGEVREKAAYYLRQAGNKAAARSALPDARAWFEQALGVLEALPASQSTLEQAFEIRFELRTVLTQLGEPRPALERLREAEVLAERLKDDHRRARVCSVLMTLHTLLGEFDEALMTGTRALEMAERLGDVRLRIFTSSYLEQAQYYRGEYERVVELATSALAILPADWVYEHFGMVAPASVYARSWLVISLAELGRFGEAAARAAEAIRLAEATQHAYTIGLAYRAAGTFHLLKGDWAQARARLEHGIAVLRTGNVVLSLSASVAGSAWVLAQLGDTSEALHRLHSEEWRGFRYREGEQVVVGHAVGRMRRGWDYYALGRASLLLGRLDEARRFGDCAVEFLSSQPGAAAHALHLLGDIATHPERFDAARGEAHYRQALALAESRGMRPLQAHCHRDLGTLYSRTGQSAQASAELSTAIDMYRDMEMTFWLPQAEGALEQLKS